MRYLILISIMAVIAMCFGTTAKAAGPCGLNLNAPKLGELRFATPEGGKAVREILVKKFLVCSLLRRDGSLFARLQQDGKGNFLEVVFYRRNGTLWQSISATYDGGKKSAVKVTPCTSDSQAILADTFWRKTKNWYVGKTPDYIKKESVITAVRNAQGEWTNNQNDCGVPDQAQPPAKYIGTTTTKIGHDGKSVVDWGTMDGDQTCKAAVACAITWTGDDGKPNESDIRFNVMYDWAVDGHPFKYDIRSVAAHEIGHTLHFDHVTETLDEWLVMWPYSYQGDIARRKLGKGDAIENNKHY